MYLISFLKRSQNGLAKQVYQVQLEQDWPGLAQKVEEICNKIGIPDVSKHLTTKNSFKLALRNHDKEEMIVKMTRDYKKLDKLKWSV